VSELCAVTALQPMPRPPRAATTFPADLLPVPVFTHAVGALCPARACASVKQFMNAATMFVSQTPQLVRSSSPAQLALDAAGEVNPVSAAPRTPRATPSRTPAALSCLWTLGTLALTTTPRSAPALGTSGERRLCRRVAAASPWWLPQHLMGQ
jgi:hypothetical protein